MKVNCIHPKKYDTYKVNKQTNRTATTPDNLTACNLLTVLIDLIFTVLPHQCGIAPFHK